MAQFLNPLLLLSLYLFSSLFAYYNCFTRNKYFL